MSGPAGQTHALNLINQRLFGLNLHMGDGAVTRIVEFHGFFFSFQEGYSWLSVISDSTNGPNLKFGTLNFLGLNLSSRFYTMAGSTYSRFFTPTEPADALTQYESEFLLNPRNVKII